jgi:formate dehydrogenase assembly factor FdhD
VGDGVSVGVGVGVNVGVGVGVSTTNNVGVGVVLGFGVGEGVVVTVRVGVGVTTGVGVGEGTTVTVGVGVNETVFAAGARTSCRLSACVTCGVKMDGISNPNTSKVKKISPLFLRIFIFTFSFILYIKKPSLFPRRITSSCSGNKINIVF